MNSDKYLKYKSKYLKYKSKSKNENLIFDIIRDDNTKCEKLKEFLTNNPRLNLNMTGSEIELSPLIYTIKNKDRHKCIKLLLLHEGVDPNYIITFQGTPYYALLAALEFSYDVFTKLLTNEKIDLNKTQDIFDKIIIKNKKREFGILDKYIKDKSIKNKSINIPNNIGFTAYSSKYNSNIIFDLMLNDPDKKYKLNEDTELMFNVIEKNDNEIFDKIISLYGLPNVNMMNKYGKTLLTESVKNNNLYVFDWLMDRPDIEIFTQDNNGYSSIQDIINNSDILKTNYFIKKIVYSANANKRSDYLVKVFYYINSTNIKNRISQDKNLIDLCYNIIDGTKQFIETFDKFFEKTDNMFTQDSLVKPFYIRHYNTENDTGSPDYGIDASGLTKDAFDMLAKYLTTEGPAGTSIMWKDEDTLTFSINVNLKDNEKDNEKNNKKIKLIGQLIGYSLLFGYTFPIKLHPLIYYQLLNTDFKSIDYDQIIKIISNVDERLLNADPFLCRKENYFYTRPYCYQKEDGSTIDFINTKEYITESIKGKYYNDISNSINSLRNGFNEIIGLDMKRDLLSPLVLNKILNGVDNFTFEEFKKIVLYECNDNNSQLSCDDIKKFIFGIFEDINKSYTDYGPTLLKAITGSYYYPVNGYEHPLTIKIVKSTTIDPITGIEKYIEKFPGFDLHTCFNYINFFENKLIEQYNLYNSLGKNFEEFKKTSVMYEYLNKNALSNLNQNGCDDH
jgi:hypothetical protein